METKMNLKLFAVTIMFCIFAVQTVRYTLISRRASGYLLKDCLGFFVARISKYWRLPIRSYYLTLRDKLSTVCSVYGNRFFIAYHITLNANSYE